MKRMIAKFLLVAAVCVAQQPPRKPAVGKSSPPAKAAPAAGIERKVQQLVDSMVNDAVMKTRKDDPSPAFDELMKLGPTAEAPLLSLLKTTGAEQDLASQAFKTAVDKGEPQSRRTALMNDAVRLRTKISVCLEMLGNLGGRAALAYLTEFPFGPPDPVSRDFQLQVEQTLMTVVPRVKNRVAKASLAQVKPGSRLVLAEAAAGCKELASLLAIEGEGMREAQLKTYQRLASSGECLPLERGTAVTLTATEQNGALREIALPGAAGQGQTLWVVVGTLSIPGETPIGSYRAAPAANSAQVEKLAEDYAQAFRADRPTGAARARLIALGKPAAPALFAMLQQRVADAQQARPGLFVFSNNRTKLASILRGIADDSTYVLVCLDALGEVGEPSAIPYLRRLPMLLPAPDAKGRESTEALVADTIQKITARAQPGRAPMNGKPAEASNRNAEAAQELVSSLMNPMPPNQRAGIEKELMELGQAAIDPAVRLIGVVQNMKRDPEYIRLTAMSAAAGPNRPSLTTADYAQLSCAKVLLAIGDPRALPALESLLRDRELQGRTPGLAESVNRLKASNPSRSYPTNIR